MSLVASDFMRVLSPRMLPPESWLLGSIASTATFCRCSRIRKVPSTSITLLLPARNPSDADANGFAAVGKAVFEDALRQFAVGCARTLDHRDGLCQHGALTLEDSIDVLLRRKRAATVRGLCDQFQRRLRHHAPGANTQCSFLRV